ncbi:PREDICTED: KH domain-containing protein At4g18375 [Tarenaya hassleriana]|uniref:KH domain-containing protein At4g18375 n=1 Tax=Tarenaya hassleriana TaxID=28532 RepID=UPI00053C0E4F|nr:PREDICTED: KH domain-containing protein At4g18375 [Tarenaya hassleriana]
MAGLRNIHDQKGIGHEDTVYRYLCPVKKVGSIIGKGGEIVKQIRSETKSNVRIDEAFPGCEERVVTIYSSREETNPFGDDGELVSPAFDALFKLHERIVAEELDADNNLGENEMITVRMLVPSDQIGCIIGKGGQVIENLRSETGAQIRVIKDNLPACALSHDDLLQIIGEPLVVRDALYQVASRIHDNPSRFQLSLLSSSSNMHQPGGMVMGGALTSSHRNYSAHKGAAYAREFSVCFICPAGNIGGVIGKGGGFINQLRRESGASIRVNTSGNNEEDCLIFVASNEFFEDQSPTVTAALHLQLRCSERVGKDSGDSSIVTRLLVPSSQIGCLIGKGGAIISEMRSVTKANIRIGQKEDLPKAAHEDEEMVQITGSVDVAVKALSQIILRLRANVFEMDRALVLLPSFFPYISPSTETFNKPKHGKRVHSRPSSQPPTSDRNGSQLNSNSQRRER